MCAYIYMCSEFTNGGQNRMLWPRVARIFLHWVIVRVVDMVEVLASWWHWPLFCALKGWVFTQWERRRKIEGTITGYGHISWCSGIHILYIIRNYIKFAVVMFVSVLCKTSVRNTWSTMLAFDLEFSTVFLDIRPFLAGFYALNMLNLLMLL